MDLKASNVVQDSRAILDAILQASYGASQRGDQENDSTKWIVKDLPKKLADAVKNCTEYIPDAHEGEAQRSGQFSEPFLSLISVVSDYFVANEEAATPSMIESLFENVVHPLSAIHPAYASTPSYKLLHVASLIAQPALSKTAMKKAYGSREDFRCLGIASAANSIIDQLHARAVNRLRRRALLLYLSPLSYQEEARKIVSFLLGSIDVKFLDSVCDAILELLPELKASSALDSEAKFSGLLTINFGSLLHEAWLNTRDPGMALNIESKIEEWHGFMMKAQDAFSGKFADLLYSFHMEKDPKTREFVCRVLPNIIEESICVANQKVREHAAILLCRTFPLVDVSLPARDYEIQIETWSNRLVSILEDPNPQVRAASIGNVAKLLMEAWEIVPVSSLNKIVAFLFERGPRDTSSALVRASSIDAIRLLLSNENSKLMIKDMLPSLSKSLHDVSPQVRLAMSRLLLTASHMPDIHFADICPAESIFTRLVKDTMAYNTAKGPQNAAICANLVRVMIPSIVDDEIALETQVRNVIKLAKMYPGGLCAMMRHAEAKTTCVQRLRLAAGLFRIGMSAMNDEGAESDEDSMEEPGSRKRVSCTKVIDEPMMLVLLSICRTLIGSLRFKQEVGRRRKGVKYEGDELEAPAVLSFIEAQFPIELFEETLRHIAEVEEDDRVAHAILDVYVELYSKNCLRLENWGSGKTPSLGEGLGGSAGSVLSAAESGLPAAGGDGLSSEGPPSLDEIIEKKIKRKLNKEIINKLIKKNKKIKNFNFIFLWINLLRQTHTLLTNPTRQSPLVKDDHQGHHPGQYGAHRQGNHHGGDSRSQDSGDPASDRRSKRRASTKRRASASRQASNPSAPNPNAPDSSVPNPTDALSGNTQGADTEFNHQDFILIQSFWDHILHMATLLSQPSLQQLSGYELEQTQRALDMLYEVTLTVLNQFLNSRPDLILGFPSPLFNLWISLYPHLILLCLFRYVSTGPGSIIISTDAPTTGLETPTENVPGRARGSKRGKARAKGANTAKDDKAEMPPPTVITILTPQDIAIKALHRCSALSCSCSSDIDGADRLVLECVSTGSLDGSVSQARNTPSKVLDQDLFRSSIAALGPCISALTGRPDTGNAEEFPEASANNDKSESMDARRLSLFGLRNILIQWFACSATLGEAALSEFWDAMDPIVLTSMKLPAAYVSTEELALVCLTYASLSLYDVQLPDHVTVERGSILVREPATRGEKRLRNGSSSPENGGTLEDSPACATPEETVVRRWPLSSCPRIVASKCHPRLHKVMSVLSALKLVRGTETSDVIKESLRSYTSGVSWFAQVRPPVLRLIVQVASSLGADLLGAEHSPPESVRNEVMNSCLQAFEILQGSTGKTPVKPKA